MYDSRDFDNSNPPPARPRIPLRRVLVLFVPALLSLGVAALILVWEENTPPGWQRAMEAYLAPHVAAPRDVLGTAQAGVAQFSFFLSADTPFRPVTPSVHYQTQPLPQGIPADAPESLGTQPLPYPVLELYCIDLSSNPNRAIATRYLVANHRDLHSSDWIVYIPAEWATAQAIDAAWAEVGCAAE